MVRLGILVIGVLVAGAGAVSAERVAVGPVKFEAPAGWERAKGEDVAFSSAGDRDARRCVMSVRLLPPVKDEAGLRQRLAEGMRAALGKAEFGPPAVQVGLHEQGYLTLACWVMPGDGN